MGGKKQKRKRGPLNDGIPGDFADYMYDVFYPGGTSSFKVRGPDLTQTAEDRETRLILHQITCGGHVEKLDRWLLDDLGEIKVKQILTYCTECDTIF